MGPWKILEKDNLIGLHTMRRHILVQ